MINLANATVKWAFNLPMGSELASRSSWQGANVAVDPRDEKAYLIQMQVAGRGPGDMEDINFNRYALTEKDDVLTGATHIDTMTGKGFGHVQTLHTRISAEGNVWHWLGIERYDSNNLTVGLDVYRVPHRRGVVDRSAGTRIYTGPGSASVLPSLDWDIVLRRRSGSFEIVEWHKELKLRERTKNDDKVRPLPSTSLVVPVGDSVYQGAAASPVEGNFIRINGPTDGPSVMTAFSGQWIANLDFTSAVPPDAYVSSREPEMVFWHKDVLYVGKRFNGLADRIVSYFTVS